MKIADRLSFLIRAGQILGIVPYVMGVTAATSLLVFFTPAFAVEPNRVTARISGEFNTGKGLAVIRGDYNPKNKYEDWKDPSPGVSYVFPEGEERPLQTLEFRQNGKDRIWFFSQTVNEMGQCEACPPSISVLALTKDGTGWRVDGMEKELMVFGFYGYADEGKLVTIGKDEYGVLFDGETGNHGEKGGNMELVYEYGGAITTFQIAETSASNEEACDKTQKRNECYSFDSELTTVPSGNKKYFDLLISTKGTELKKDRKVAVNRAQRFVFDNGEYSLAAK